MTNELSIQHKTVFESIKEIDENGKEFWGVRKLPKVLEYSELCYFVPVIERAQEGYVNSNHRVKDHFEDYLEVIKHGKGARQTERQSNHIEIEKKVRKTIEEIGGILPENLRVADSTKKLGKAYVSRPLKNLNKK